MKVVCTICTDQIKEDFCAAPCGHTFHYGCLSQWLAHQKTCPQCREKCLPRNVIKLFINSNDLSQLTDTQIIDPQEMKEKLSLLEDMMMHKDKALLEARASLNDIQKEMKAWQLQHKETHKKLKLEQADNGILKRELRSLQNELDTTHKLRHEIEHLKSKLLTLEGVEKILKGSREEVDTLVMNYHPPSELAKFTVALKRDYEVLKEKLKEKGKLSEEIVQLKKRLQSREKEVQFCQNQLSMFESDLHTAEERERTLQLKVEMLQQAVESPGSRCALKRMFESPMPDHSTKTLELRASPLLTSTQSVVPCSDIADGEADLLSKQIIGRKRPNIYKENIIMPVNKTFKSGKTVLARTLSSHVLKKGLKFAPRKNKDLLVVGKPFKK